MKLYTEEQVKQAMIAMHDVKFMDYTEKEIIDTLIPIELPSDEEIEERAKDYADVIGNRNGTAIFDYTNGAKWMRDKIKQKALLKEIMEADEKDGLYDENK